MDKQRLSRTTLLRWCLAGVLLLGLLFSVTAFATSNTDFENTRETLPQGETIEGPGFFGGTIVRIDGTVNGTAFVAGQNVEVNGVINGDLFVAGQHVIITGQVTGNIYMAGMTLRMEGQVEQDTFMAGQYLTVREGAVLGRDLFTAGFSILQEAEVGRHMYGAGENITLAGTIGGDANFAISELTLLETAVIRGDLDYQSDREATIETGAMVEGETNFTRVTRSEGNQMGMMRERSVMNRVLGFVWSLLSILLVWFVIKFWRPTWWERTASPLRERPLAALGIGVATLGLAPLVILLLMVTIIGIPLALLLIAALLILLYLAKIIVAVSLVMWLNQRYHWMEGRRGGWLVVLALVVLALLRLVPFVNFFVFLLVIICGVGSFVLSHYRPRRVDAPYKN